MPKRKSGGFPRARKSKTTHYKRTILKFRIPSILDFVQENESELGSHKPNMVQASPIRKVMGNPWVIGISTGFIVWAVTSFYW